MGVAQTLRAVVAAASAGVRVLWGPFIQPISVFGVNWRQWEGG